MAQIAYIVTEGEHNDYCIAGVFSTRELAQEFIDRTQQGGRIEEHPVDPSMDQLRQGLRLYNVWMRRDGSVQDVSRDRIADDTNENAYYTLEADTFIPPRIVASVWARDEQHAIKIVNERRLQMIAEGELT